jgi:hypothetical protein
MWRLVYVNRDRDYGKRTWDTAAETRLGVRLVFAVAVTTSWAATHLIKQRERRLNLDGWMDGMLIPLSIE